MQLADGDARASEPSERAFLSPGKAFALLFGVILLLGAGVFFLRPDAPAEPTPTSDPPVPTFELTNAEAITRFEELDALRQLAYRSGDSSLIDQVFVPGSDIADDVADEIQRLSRGNVVDLTEFETVRLTVLTNEDQAALLRQVVIVNPRFETKNGRDVTSQPQPVRQVIDWTLEQQNGTWLIAAGVVRESEILK